MFCFRSQNDYKTGQKKNKKLTQVSRSVLIFKYKIKIIKIAKVDTAAAQDPVR